MEYLLATSKESGLEVNAVHVHVSQTEWRAIS